MLDIPNIDDTKTSNLDIFSTFYEAVFEYLYIERRIKLENKHEEQMESRRREGVVYFKVFLKLSKNGYMYVKYLELRNI